MDGMDGIDLAHLVRAKHPELPILLVSGYMEDSQKLQALPDGVQFRRKPIHVQEIKAMVEASCDLA